MHPVDIAIICIYLAITAGLGFWVSKKATKSLKSYFLGDNSLSWSVLGLSNASGMFDISGTMWMVTILFVYGLKSAWLPWLWPVWNQVFMMVFLAAWLRRSNVMTGAQWITHRFGDGRGATLSHLIVTIFAIISVFGFLAYFFVGIGKFASIFFPWDMSLSMGILNVTSEQGYAIFIIGITTIYAIKGGMYSVVITEVLQFVLMTLSGIAIGVIAFSMVDHDMVMQAVPEGWDQLFFGWNLDLDWSDHLASVNDKINADGFQLFGYLFMMMLFKGAFASLAGPVPSYDMQRVLSTKSPSEASKMSGFTILVLLTPRYLMVAGFAVLGLVFLKPEFQNMGSTVDFEVVLPLAIERFVPVGIKGLLLAGLLAAFMGTFAAFINAAPAYIVNDIYKKYINPNASERTYVRYSYLSSILLVVLGLIGGLFAASINSLTLWITSALYGGYAAANVLKWIWWRFNGYGYFFGMFSGLLAATILPLMFPDVIAIYLFPAIFLISLGGSVIGSLSTPAEDDEVLKTFYKQTYPWGFWKPVVKMIQGDIPGYEANKGFRMDLINVIVGIIWQMTLALMPIYLIIKDFNSLLVAAAIFVATIIWLKLYWYDNLASHDLQQSKIDL